MLQLEKQVGWVCIRDIKKGDGMKKQNFLWLLLVQCFVSRQYIRAHQVHKGNRPISITDFRPPSSLTELLQEGFHMTQLYLQENNVGMAEAEISKLNDVYESMFQTTRHNQILNEDKDFLQGLIDRIDKLIEELEQDPTKKSSDVQAAHIKTIRVLFENLKDKISE